MEDRDPRLDLILAYTEAGLLDKAEALKREMLAEHLGHKPRDFTDIKAGLDAAQARFDDAMDKLTDKLGVSRRPRKPKPK